MMRTEHITLRQHLDARRALATKRDELLWSLSRRYDLHAEREHDPLDETVRQAERDQACREITADTALLREVSAALQRLNAGCWGVCCECGEAIPPARLAALPWAANCRECQEQAEMAGVEA